MCKQASRLGGKVRRIDMSNEIHRAGAGPGAPWGNWCALQNVVQVLRESPEDGLKRNEVVWVVKTEKGVV